MTDDRIGEIWRLPENYCKPLAFGRAIEAECRVPDGWQLVPMEPTASQLDVAVSFALNVKLCNDYNWSAYMRDVYARMLAAAPKPEPERKHETVPTLAEPSEYAKSFQDMITHGYSFMKDGMRIPPEDVIEPAEPDCECGAVASEHCPACEPVAQEYQPLGPATTEDQKIYDSIAANYSQPVAQEPVAFGVREEDGSGGVWSWIAEWPEAAHEHINDAIDRYLGEVGDHPPKYTVVPLYRAPHDLAALLKDAERYRWLRADSRPAAWRLEYWVGYWECSTFGDDLDAAIDKELAKCTTS